jgi:hypothetical protein
LLSIDSLQTLTFETLHSVYGNLRRTTEAPPRR